MPSNGTRNIFATSEAAQAYRPGEVEMRIGVELLTVTHSITSRNGGMFSDNVSYAGHQARQQRQKVPGRPGTVNCRSRSRTCGRATATNCFGAARHIAHEPGDAVGVIERVGRTGRSSTLLGVRFWKAPGDLECRRWRSLFWWNSYEIVRRQHELLGSDRADALE